MINIVLEQDGDEWIAKGDISDAQTTVFDGVGATQREAIGDYIVSNREELKVTFGFIGEDGQIMLSTIFGKPRRFNQMGPNEKKHLAE